MRDIQDEMLTKVAKQMQVEIDQYIMDDLIREDLKAKGWIHSPVKGLFRREVLEWTHENTKGDHKMVHGEWWFEDGADAMMFLLRWS
jgi:hypothetical protein